MTSSRGAGTGSGLNITASSSVKIAVLAPMPSASVPIADERKRGVLDERARGVAEILAKVVEPRERPHVAMHFDGLDHAAEVPQRRQARLVRRQALPDVLVGRFRQVARELVVHLAIELPRPAERAQRGTAARAAASWQVLRDREEAADDVGGALPLGASAWSCLRPARVSA